MPCRAGEQMEVVALQPPTPDTPLEFVLSTTSKVIYFKMCLSETRRDVIAQVSLPADLSNLQIDFTDCITPLGWKIPNRMRDRCRTLINFQVNEFRKKKV